MINDLWQRQKKPHTTRQKIRAKKLEAKFAKGAGRILKRAKTQKLLFGRLNSEGSTHSSLVCTGRDEEITARYKATK